MSHSIFDTIEDQNPLEIFQTWLDDAMEQEKIFPDAFTLATYDKKMGQPKMRTLLLKGMDDKGFHFYTNYDSEKGCNLSSHPQASMLFYWKSTQRQVTIEGATERLSSEISDAYFATRPRKSQIGAWASRQSKKLDNREDLEKRITEYTEHYEGQDIPRPPHWGGFRLIPARIEFWQIRDYRLHDRVVYTTKANKWDASLINP